MYSFASLESPNVHHPNLSRDTSVNASFKGNHVPTLCSAITMLHSIHMIPITPLNLPHPPLSQALRSITLPRPK